MADDEIIEILALDDIIPGGNAGPVDIIDNLNSARTDAALSANQGRVLKGMIADIPTGITHVETSASPTVSWEGDGTPAGGYLKANVISVPNSIVGQDSTHQFVTDAQITSWTSKQAALGFTPENIANKNQANGYAGIGSDGKINASQLPAQTVDWTNIDNKPATFAPIIGSGATQAVAGNDVRLTNARTPTAHTHPIDQIAGLQAALDLKANISTLKPVATSGLYQDLTGKPIFSVLATLPVDLSGYPDGSEIIITG